MSVFLYPTVPHVRRHAPRGYRSYQAFKSWLRDEFRFCCVFCRVRERWFANGQDAFSVDHFIPRAVAPDRVGEYHNLLYVCLSCNAAKRDQQIALDPCQHALGEHLRVTSDGSIEGLTPQGRQMSQELLLDSPDLTEFRGRMLRVVRFLGQNPDPQTAAQLRDWLGYPDALPDLRVLRPPLGNARPAAVTTCHFVLREQGTLAEIY